MVAKLLLSILLFPALAFAQFIPNVEKAATGGATDHGALTGLTDDDHTQYFLLAGRAGGQTARGGTASGDDLTLSTTSDATKGDIILGSVTAFNETTETLNLGATTPTQANRLYATSTGDDTSGQENTMRVVMAADPSASSSASIRALDVYANLADTYTTAVTGSVMGSRYLAGNTRQTGLLSSLIGLQLQAINGIVFGSPSGTATSDNITAAIFQAVNNSATTTATATVTGGQFTGENRGTNVIGAVTAGQFTVTNNNASATSTALRANWLRTSTVFGSSVTAGTVTTGYMLDSEGWPSGPTYTNRPYQIRLQSGATAAYGLYQAGTAHYNILQGKTTFGETSDATGLVEINGNADDEQLRVIGHSTQTSNIVLVENSAGTDLFNVSNTGTATFAGDVTVPDEAYDATAWNGSLEVPTKNAIRDKIETMSGGTHTLLDATSHTDTAADTVSRGSLIYGNSTPAWDELVIGAANTYLKSDGTDASWAAITGLPTTSYKTADTSRTTETGADGHITGVTLATNKYAIEGYLYAVGSTTTPDIIINLTVTTSTVNLLNMSYVTYDIANGAAIDNELVAGSGTNTTAIQLTTDGTIISIKGFLDVTNAGTLALHWQRSGGSGTTTLKRGSWIKLTPM